MIALFSSEDSIYDVKLISRVKAGSGNQNSQHHKCAGASNGSAYADWSDSLGKAYDRSAAQRPDCGGGELVAAGTDREAG